MKRSKKRCGAMILLSLLLGCASGEILPGLGIGAATVPFAPGDTPFVMVRCLNSSSVFAIDFLIQTESTTSSGIVTGGGNLLNIRSNGGVASLILPCPVDRITLGNLNDPNATGFRVGIPGQEKIQVVWGENPLVAGFSYNCGDTVIFLAIDDQSSSGGILVSSGLIGGASQTGPFTGPDTFANLEDLLIAEGLLSN